MSAGRTSTGSLACFLLLSLISLSLFPLVHNADPTIPEATIAFEVTVSPQHLAYLPRFLRSIYHPSNYYLLDLPHSFPAERLAELCPPGSAGVNVWARNPRLVTPDGISEVLRTLSAMSFFLGREENTVPPSASASSDRNVPLDYFLNMTPDEYPLLGPGKLRRLLGYARSRHPSASFLAVAPRAAWRSRESLAHLDALHYDPAVVFSANATLVRAPFAHPDRTRRAFALPRGDPRLVAARPFVEAAASSMLAKRLLLTLGESSHAREHFFQALAFNARELRRDVVLSNLRCAAAEARDERTGELSLEELSCAFLDVPGDGSGEETRDLIDAAVSASQDDPGAQRDDPYVNRVFGFVKDAFDVNKDPT